MYKTHLGARENVSMLLIIAGKSQPRSTAAVTGADSTTHQLLNSRL